jgi:hypothetical protein
VVVAPTVVVVAPTVVVVAVVVVGRAVVVVVAAAVVVGAAEASCRDVENPPRAVVTARAITPTSTMGRDGRAGGRIVARVGEGSAEDAAALRLLRQAVLRGLRCSPRPGGVRPGRG